MARTYRRDSNGRFASGGGGSARPKARSAPRGLNRLTRDNAGRITSVGGQGATARGGRLRTAAGNRRATVTAKIKGGGGRLRGGNGKSPTEPVLVQRATKAKGYRIPSPTKPVLVQRAKPVKGYQIPKPPAQTSPRSSLGQRMERSIAGIASRRVRISASPQKQWNAEKTQKRAAEYLRAASRFAAAKGVSLARGLRSGPKNSTKPKRRRR